MKYLRIVVNNHRGETIDFFIPLNKKEVASEVECFVHRLNGCYSKVLKVEFVNSKPSNW